MKLSIVIPAYNEEKDIEKAVMEVAKLSPAAEIIVVNDASTDKTLEILEFIKANYVINLKILTNMLNNGHGFSVVRGLKEASGDYILYIDADRQIGLDNLKQLEGEKYDFVSGWRTGRQDKLFRKFISFCLKMTNLIFHRYYIKDANCPFKLYRRGALHALIDELPKSYVVPIACLEVLARKYKYKTVTIPTPHKPYEGERKGFLQILNLKALQFFSSAFFEIVRL